MIITERLSAGRHAIERLERDILVYRIRGELLPEHILPLMERQRAWQSGKRFVLIAVDVHGFEGVSPSTMRSLRDPNAQPIPRAVAIFGASFAARTVAGMIFRALRLLLQKPILVEFFDEEKLALEWLEQSRARLAASVTPDSTGVAPL